MRIGSSTLLGRFVQSASANRRRLISYADRLNTGETITDVSVSIDNTTSPAFEIDNIVIGPDGDRIAFYAHGGVEKEEYVATFTVTTSLAQTYVDEARFGIVEVARG